MSVHCRPSAANEVNKYIMQTLLMPKKVTEISCLKIHFYHVIQSWWLDKETKQEQQQWNKISDSYSTSTRKKSYIDVNRILLIIMLLSYVKLSQFAEKAFKLKRCTARSLPVQKCPQVFFPSVHPVRSSWRILFPVPLGSHGSLTHPVCSLN